MKVNLLNPGSSAIVGFLLILPFVIMEVVNRRSFQEEFPFVLFFGMWFLTFAFSLILLPIVRGGLARNSGMASPILQQGNTLLTNPRPAAIISIALFLFPFLLALLDSLGWVPIQALINGPNPDQEYLPGLFITIALFSLPVAAGVIASGPIVRTLRAGGSLLAHPVHLIIVALLLSLFAFGLGSLIVDQWSCFTGVPLCD